MPDIGRLLSMFGKKFLVLFMIICLGLCDAALAVETVMPSVVGSMRPARIKKEEKKKKEYRFKTVLKHYNPYILTITNKNTKPVLFSSDTEVHFLLDGGYDLTSQSRRAIYRKSRKRDMGRYYWVAIPGAVIAAGITGITLFLGAPIAAVVAVSTSLPADKAVRTNVGISQDLFNTHDMPIRMEPGTTYEVTLLVPKKADVQKVKITNVSFDMKKMYEMTFPVVKEEKL